MGMGMGMGMGMEMEMEMGMEMGMEMEMEIQIIPRAFFGQAQVGIDFDILYFSRNINCKILFKS